MLQFALSAAPSADAAASAAETGEKSIGWLEGLMTGSLGYAVVFFGLVLLMTVIAIFGKVMAKKKAEAAPEAAPASSAPANEPVAEKAELDPNAGMRDGKRVCDIYSVDDKTAAMIMAIVADQTKIPLNELRFISIKEV